jgi:hypothetical protein
MAHGV